MALRAPPEPLGVRKGSESDKQVLTYRNRCIIEGGQEVKTEISVQMVTGPQGPANRASDPCRPGAATID